MSTVPITTTEDIESTSALIGIVGRGAAYPFQFSPARGGVSEVLIAEGRKKIEGALRVLLLTLPGERVNNPLFGCRLKQLIHDPYDEAWKALARNAIQTAVDIWEKRVILRDIAFIEDEVDSHIVKILLVYEIRGTTITGSYVFPFVLRPRTPSEGRVSRA